MGPDEFVKDVAKSPVLTPEEALDIVLHVKKSTPRNKLPFSDKPRVGTWQEQLFNCSYYSQLGTYNSFNQYFNLQGNAEVVSIYFLNASNYNNIKLTLQSTSTRIRVLENRHQCGQQLYEAVFEPPVKLQSGGYSVSFYCGGNYFSVLQVTGQNTLQFNRATITMDYNPWCMIVGFKLKSSN